QTRTIMQEELLRIWATLGKTVVYVTHSLEEALLLGDRVVLLTARPGRVSQIYPVDLGRPRALEVRASPAYGALLEKIWSRLREGLDHVFAVIYPIPSVLFLTLVSFLVPPGEIALVVTTAVTSFFLIAFTTTHGVRQIDRLVVEAARHYGARGWRLFAAV